MSRKVFRGNLAYTHGGDGEARWYTRVIEGCVYVRPRFTDERPAWNGGFLC